MVTKLILAECTLDSNGEMYLSWRNFLFDIDVATEYGGILGLYAPNFLNML